MADNDLSPYELARLERIKRNEERLYSLGLLGKTSSLKPKPPLPKNTKNASGKKRRSKSPTPPTRSSKRLRVLNKKEVEKSAVLADSYAEEGRAEVAEEKPSYDTMPNEPESLDDNEFQVYVALRAWRLRRKNELEVEPYKICQNKTLCHLIRMRRNDACFASQKLSEEEVENALLSVWGIGPSKAAVGGFGWEMLEVLDEEENGRLLELSRKNGQLNDEAKDDR